MDSWLPFVLNFVMIMLRYDRLILLHPTQTTKRWKERFLSRILMLTHTIWTGQFNWRWVLFCRSRMTTASQPTNWLCSHIKSKCKNIKELADSFITAFFIEKSFSSVTVIIYCTCVNNSSKSCICKWSWPLWQRFSMTI